MASLFQLVHDYIQLSIKITDAAIVAKTEHEAPALPAVDQPIINHSTIYCPGDPAAYWPYGTQIVSFNSQGPFKDSSGFSYYLTNFWLWTLATRVARKATIGSTYTLGAIGAHQNRATVQGLHRQDIAMLPPMLIPAPTLQITVSILALCTTVLTNRDMVTTMLQTTRLATWVGGVFLLTVSFLGQVENVAAEPVLDGCIPGTETDAVVGGQLQDGPFLFCWSFILTQTSNRLPRRTIHRELAISQDWVGGRSGLTEVKALAQEKTRGAFYLMLRKKREGQFL